MQNSHVMPLNARIIFTINASCEILHEKVIADK